RYINSFIQTTVWSKAPNHSSRCGPRPGGCGTIYRSPGRRRRRNGSGDRSRTGFGSRRRAGRRRRLDGRRDGGPGSRRGADRLSGSPTLEGAVETQVIAGAQQIGRADIVVGGQRLPVPAEAEGDRVER